jgi:N-acetylmuramoyl-L-alanine amidase
MHQARLAAAIHQGVHDYFYANPPAGTRVAQLATGGAPRTVIAASSGGAGE